MGTGMGFFATIIVGLIAGWVAERATRSNHGILTNLVIGVIGSVVGNYVAERLNISLFGWIDHIVAASLGAVATLFIYQMLFSKKSS